MTKSPLSLTRCHQSLQGLAQLKKVQPQFEEVHSGAPAPDCPQHIGGGVGKDRAVKEGGAPGGVQLLSPAHVQEGGGAGPPAPPPLAVQTQVTQVIGDLP